MRTNILDFEKCEDRVNKISEHIIRDCHKCNAISNMNNYYKEEWILENMFN